MIDSTSLEADSHEHLSMSISENHPKKFDDINNNHQYQEDGEESLFDCNNTMKQNIFSSNNHENDTTLLTTTTTTTTVEFQLKTSSRKRKLNLINPNNNDEHINKQPTITKKKKKPPMIKIDPDEKKKKKKKQTVDQSSVTDESSFGSCEPGTNVVLQGIVWNETDKGVLVVNITWRGKTYVGALLNTTEQNWAPPRYKSDVRSTKPNQNRDNQVTLIPPSHEPTERILRNGKRRGSSTTVTPSSTTKTRSFKIPEAPSSSFKSDETSTTTVITNEKVLVPSATNLNDEDEINDNYSSRSVSPTTSGISTTSSSSPPLSNNNENQSTIIPMDLSNSKSLIDNDQQSKTKDSVIPYHFPSEMLFPSAINPSDYFSSTNSFSLPAFNKTSSTLSPSSYLPISSQLYFNSLTSPHYPAVSSLSKTSR